jgi:hypothetical protein
VRGKRYWLAFDGLRLSFAFPKRTESDSVGAPRCGARRKRDGQPCEAKPVANRRRCKWHGGMSTGPKTPEGKARALANLAQYRSRA